MIQFQNIPDALKELPQWVLWKTIVRGNLPTKVPFSFDGTPAKANDPNTWSEFEFIQGAFEAGGYDGIGFEFSKSDRFCGIDLDGCRDPESGQVSDWAREIVLSLDTYAEISPTRTGIKLFGIGKLPFERGRKREVTAPKVSAKTPAIEVYDWGRYFAMTGLRVRGPRAPQECNGHLTALCDKFWTDEQTSITDFHSTDAVVDRARKYLMKLPPAVANQGGHNATFHAACVLVCGFGLAKNESLGLLQEWNQLCQPPWSERELEHKISEAAKQPGERNYLRNATPQRWGQITIPAYEAPKPAEPKNKVVTLVDASQQYIDSVRSGTDSLIELGIIPLDLAIGGGVARGELILIAGRPSHGKSLAAIQIVHNWTSRGIPVLVISEEMSAIALGKRALLNMSEIPQEHWKTQLDELEQDLKWYADSHEKCYIAESLRTMQAVCDVVAEYVEQHHVEAVAVDYAQLLQSPGNGRYEQVTNTSIALRQLATKFNIVLVVLCQLNRAIESRNKYIPMLSDLRDTGQLEQDADVIIFGVWPNRLDYKIDPHQYEFWVGKNRNRPINQVLVECRLEPSRQKITEKTVEDMPNYEPAFEEYNLP